MRAVVQGIPHRASWDRYLRIEGRRATRARCAPRSRGSAGVRRRRKRQARPGTARLWRSMYARSGRRRPVLLPSLEEFAAERGLGEFSQAEQLTAYEEAFGAATTRARRRER